MVFQPCEECFIEECELLRSDLIRNDLEIEGRFMSEDAMRTELEWSETLDYIPRFFLPHESRPILAHWGHLACYQESHLGCQSWCSEKSSHDDEATGSGRSRFLQRLCFFTMCLIGWQTCRWYIYVCTYNIYIYLYIYICKYKIYIFIHINI